MNESHYSMKRVLMSIVTLWFPGHKDVSGNDVELLGGQGLYRYISWKEVNPEPLTYFKLILGKRFLEDIS